MVDVTHAPLDVQEVVQVEHDEWLSLENEQTGESYELIEGELVPQARTDNEHGAICFRFGFELRMYSLQTGKPARITESSGPYYTRADDTTARKPDVAFTFYSERVPQDQSPEFYMRTPPELIVEVISPGNTAQEMDEKTQEWFCFGVKMVLLVFPESGRVHVYPDNRHSYILTRDEKITGGDVLPGFEMPIKALFKD